MAAFIELPVVRQEGFWNDPKDATGMDDNGCIVEPPRNPHGCADAKGWEEVRTVLCQPRDRRFDGIKQSVLVQQIVDGVGRQAKLGEKP
jgi:hypothetical protein